MHGELEIEIKRTKKFLTGAGIRTPDFLAKFSRPKFEFLGRLDKLSSGYLELLDFTVKLRAVDGSTTHFWIIFSFFFQDHSVYLYYIDGYKKYSRSSQTTVIDIKTTALKNAIEGHWSHMSEH